MYSDENVVFRFERGAYFGGSLEYKIIASGDVLLFKSRSYNDFYRMKDYTFKMPEWAILEIAFVLEEVADWEEFYGDFDSCYDGYTWHIKYNHDGLKISSGGYEEYPENYKEVIRKIQTVIERLCKEYAEDYTEDRIEERLAL